MFSGPIFCSFPDASLWPGWRLSQSVGGWLPRATTFCHILILEDPGFLPQASGAGLKSLTGESTWCKTAIRMWWSGAACAVQKLSSEVLESSRTTGALWVAGETVPRWTWGGLCALSALSCCHSPPCAKRCCWGSLPESHQGKAQSCCPCQWDNYLLPKLSFTPDLLSPGICSGGIELYRRIFSFILVGLFSHTFSHADLFSQHVWLVPSQYLCRNKSRS